MWCAIWSKRRPWSGRRMWSILPLLRIALARRPTAAAEEEEGEAAGCRSSWSRKGRTCASSGKLSCTVAARGVLLVGFSDVDLDAALEDDFTDVSADDFLPLPFFFGLLFFFFCTLEGAAPGLAPPPPTAGRLPGFAFLVFPPEAPVGTGGGAIAWTSPVLEALERVVGAILLFYQDKKMQSKKSSRHVGERTKYMYTTSSGTVLCSFGLHILSCSEKLPETDCAVGWCLLLSFFVLCAFNSHGLYCVERNGGSHLRVVGSTIVCRPYERTTYRRDTDAGSRVPQKHLCYHLGALTRDHKSYTPSRYSYSITDPLESIRTTTSRRR